MIKKRDILKSYTVYRDCSNWARMYDSHFYELATAAIHAQSLIDAGVKGVEICSIDFFDRSLMT